MPTILDTDFLSSFLKIGRCDLIQSLYQVEQALIPAAVHRELARTLPDAVLLMSDNKARQFAQSLGVTVVNIPAFLLACKMAGLVSPEQMVQIIEDLRAKDFYKFKSEIRDLLLE